MTITAKFSSLCPQCRFPIQAGERVSWTPGSKATHVSCPVTSEDCEHPQFHRTGCTCARKPAGPYTVARETPSVSPFAPVLMDTNVVLADDNDDASFDAWIARPADEPARIGVDEIGVYVLPDGSIVKIQPNKEKTRTYAKRWTVIGGYRLTEALTVEHGEYVYEPGLVAQVAAQGRKMSLEEAKAFIIRYGQCCRCGRHLKDAKSVERGIGPVCVTYFSEGMTGAAVMAA